MAHMIRKQVYIEPRQEATLKRLARLEGVTEAEILRRAIDRESRLVSATWQPEETAWEEARALILSLMAQGAVPGGRTWKREDAYAERLSRYGRNCTP